MPRGRRTRSSNKRAFVLGLPEDMPAKDVVEAASKQGMKLKEHYVYVVRSAARSQSKKSGRSRVGVGARSGSLESEFRRLTLELGLGKSKELLRETEQKIADLIGGK
jgi:hypothetical protein